MEAALSARRRASSAANKSAIKRETLLPSASALRRMRAKKASSKVIVTFAMWSV
jgi:hypothetical protein